MIQGRPFWISMLVFQLLFGFAVFAITRDYYRAEGGPAIADAPAVNHPSLEPSGRFSNIDPGLLTTLSTGAATPTDPFEISRQANQFFASKDYARAANLYEKLLAFESDSAETHNNLGLTLHYLGRSDEALQRLNEGITLDPTHQRIWLTLGYVSSQVGNIEGAEKALQKAIDMGAENDIGRSAANMLEGLR